MRLTATGLAVLALMTATTFTARASSLDHVDHDSVIVHSGGLEWVGDGHHEVNGSNWTYRPRWPEGFRAVGDFTITIYRVGHSIVIHRPDQGCGSTATFGAGDLVSIAVRSGFVAAGDLYHCET